ncbi:NotI family restriction endonuclease [Pararhizobium sp. BT-229]|uniref:NotI family restriction endonuclease n=1 Tax=Pararhizobium sp. BT-229 TaxID=2986923 RepID=UPI0021F74225|nr:NotI family restriction endonuclease [Pararhizobium sp. BT-229]MCV9960931.1 NotI family restriction endonuclease [Pararhizobium sp. BT-229]
MTRIIDLFGIDTTSTKTAPDWQEIVNSQGCPYTEKRCYKVRKSQADISIGTCTVEYGAEPIIICPLRLLEKKQIFTDCLHLLTGHEPGNELHIVSEISVPGGSIDYVLASTRAGKIRDFVGIELQTLDTTGTVWPERQRFLSKVGIKNINAEDLANKKSYGMNWKMTAKTILVQLHHKIQTFEGVNKHLVLVLQDRLINYMSKEFTFDHLNDPRTSDPMHFHAYALKSQADGHHLELVKRLSTDTDGIAKCLGLQSEAKIDYEVMLRLIEQKITDRTRMMINSTPEIVVIAPQK